ncbi:outer membrane protein assembly factor BamD [Candidatus Babeliales bacterium]|nr:outer membrane protein assembly factor BamD [Candidatus Babeliales bacterium]
MSNYKKVKNIFSLLSMIFLLFLLPNCAKEDDKRVENMNFDELKQKTLSALELKNDELAVEYLEQLVASNPDKQNISEYKLMLADLYFNVGNLPSSYQLYEHYKEFYPSDIKAEFATYRAILSKFYQTLRFECDQTDTHKTINLCEEYEKNLLYNQYRKDVIDIRNTCESKLIDKEVYVFNTYLKKGKKTGKFEAAKNRLKYLRDEYFSKNSAFEARLTFLECKLAKAQNNENLLKEKVEVLVSKYPNSTFTNRAQRLINKKDFFL